jgi:hypothetical protein
MRQREYELELQKQRKAEEIEKMRLEAQRRHQKWLQLRGWQNPRSFAFNVLQHTVLAIPKLPELGYTRGNPVAFSTLDRLMNKPMLDVQPYRLDKQKIKHRRFNESDIDKSKEVSQALWDMDKMSPVSRNSTKQSERIHTVSHFDKNTSLPIAYPGYTPQKTGTNTHRTN